MPTQKVPVATEREMFSELITLNFNVAQVSAQLNDKATLVNASRAIAELFEQYKTRATDNPILYKNVEAQPQDVPTALKVTKAEPTE